MKYAIILGGNIGNVEKSFDFVLAVLESCGWLLLGRSRIYRSAAVDCVPGTPDFLNQALIGEWSDTPTALLKLGQRLERSCGRPAEHSSAESRTLDFDIVLSTGGAVTDLPGLKIPHPRATRRRFVLEPLAEIAPEWKFPDGTTVQENLDRLNRIRG